jgi:acetyl-CoA carboxylase alpha subunit
MEKQKLAHQNQIESLAKTSTQQIDMSNGEMAATSKQMQTQMSGIQASITSPSDANVARTPHREVD